MGFLLWAVIFVVIGLLALIVGAKGIAGCSLALARVFLTVFFLIALVLLVVWFVRGCPSHGTPFS